jgi:nucleoside-diphosphate-sugar epimerase
MSIGYAQSKLVAERILLDAGENFRFPITVLRVGQIAGSIDSESKMIWPRTDLIPLIIANSKLIGCLPELKNVDWIPIDNLVDVIPKILHHDLLSTDCYTYNLVNPQATPWSELLQPLLKLCGQDTKIVTIKEWLEKMKSAESSSRMVRDVPLENFVDMFNASLNGLAKHERKSKLDGGLRVSSSFAEVKLVSKELLGMWIEKWNF